MLRTPEEQQLHELIESYLKPILESVNELREEIRKLKNEEIQMSFEDSYRYNTLCARATLYPKKTIDEVMEIIKMNLTVNELIELETKRYIIDEEKSPSCDRI